MAFYYPKRIVYLTAAAAFGSSLHQQGAPIAASAFSPLLNTAARPSSITTTVHTRLYSSNKSNDNDKGGGILSSIKNAAKSILPKTWFQSDEEKQTALERKRVRDEVKGGLQEVFKDAPLPIRMMGSMIAPLLSSMASGLAESMSAQQEQMDTLLEEARSALVRDTTTSLLLGEPIVVQAPFSQSSSTTSINGKTSSQIQAAFQVVGTKSTGVARMQADQFGISSLELETSNGRRIPVNLLTTVSSSSSSSKGDYAAPSTSSLGKNPKNLGDIVDAEFVDKNDDEKK